MSSTIVNRLAIVLCGYEFIPHSVSYHEGGDRFWHAVPVCSYLIDTDEGHFLIDAGIDGRKLESPTCRQKYFPQPPGFPRPLVAPQHQLLTQLAEMGVQPNMIRHLILTHLHADHTGNTKSFSEAIVHIQEREYEASLELTPAEGYIPEEYQGLPASQVELHDGDEELFPGIDLLFTPGHTEGHQSVLLRLKDGRKFLIIGDVVDDQRNISENILPGGMTDPTAARQSLNRIQSLIQAGVQPIFLHDANQVQRLPLAPNWL